MQLDQIKKIKRKKRTNSRLKRNKKMLYFESIYIYTVSAVTWRTVHEHIVADTFRSKKSSSTLLVHE